MYSFLGKRSDVDDTMDSDEDSGDNKIKVTH